MIGVGVMGTGVVVGPRVILVSRARKLSIRPCRLVTRLLRAPSSVPSLLTAPRSRRPRRMSVVNRLVIVLPVVVVVGRGVVVGRVGCPFRVVRVGVMVGLMWGKFEAGLLVVSLLAVGMTFGEFGGLTSIAHLCSKWLPGRPSRIRKPRKGLPIGPSEAMWTTA